MACLPPNFRPPAVSTSTIFFPGALMLFDPINQRVPPHNLDAEVSCLGACLIDPEALAAVLAQLREEDLYLQAHQTILAAIRRLASKGDRPDLVTLAAELERTHHLEEVGGGAYLAELVERTFTAATVSQHLRIVKEHASRRRIIQACTRTVGAMYSGEQHPAEAAAHLSEDLDVAGSCTDGQIVPTRLNEALKAWMVETDTRSQPARVKTPSPKLNATLGGGFGPGELIFLGARAGVGKTSLSLEIARAAAEAGTGVLVVSREMLVASLTRRILSQSTRILSSSIKAGLFADDEYPHLIKTYGQLATLPLWMTDRAVSLQEIVRLVEGWSFTPPLGLVVVDYLQLVRVKSESRRLEVEAVSQGLKSLALKTSIPILCLSSLRRPSAEAKESRPGLSDLRESGELEHDADVVIFLHRAQGEEETEINVAKNRDGRTGKTLLRFRPEFVAFDEAEG